ncbi:helix-turn-helix domain-containing protein [Allokutzneria sp. A3M-2-11 16]|uniref:helix-turn-helix domain-containing protein n=1 Tax=Allokutzneria sp. A3M-2-11 16 TaxID=2962043 RepID=UPI0020B64BD4|nr:helix-turn-helix domain-containing protein [Allokutzneria sp. A3M-2-11 16]MCP3801835.1 helix-turn-helix domain-containing protein [Allokutzneria sp. A3M-2-11 16]
MTSAGRAAATSELSFQEAARELGVSTRTITRLRASGELAVVMIGGRPRVPASEITDYRARALKAGRNAAAARRRATR